MREQAWKGAPRGVFLAKDTRNAGLCSRVVSGSGSAEVKGKREEGKEVRTAGLAMA